MLVGNMLGGFVQIKGCPIRDKIREFFFYKSHEPLAGILGSRRLKFGQMMSIGFCIAPSEGLQLLHSDI